MKKEIKHYRQQVEALLIGNGKTILTNKFEPITKTLMWLADKGYNVAVRETARELDCKFRGYLKHKVIILIEKVGIIMSPQEFLNDTLGKKIDVDGSFGFQCWDYFAWFCKQVGYPVFNCTVTGYVKDIWNTRKTSGILNYFNETVTPKFGDWVIWDDCAVAPYSHIGMVKEYRGKSVICVSQNQGGKSEVTQLEMSTSGVLGYLRPKCWEINTTYIKVGDLVRPMIALSYDGVKLRTAVLNHNYHVIEVNGDRVVLGDGLNTAFHATSLKLSTPAYELKVGSKVKLINAVDYDGTKLASFVLKNTYTVMQINNNRIVVGINGAVTCAVNSANLQIVG